MADENEIYQKKNGFILYKNYIKSVSKMTNEQAGELFKIILHYANTGELLESEDPRVDTALDFIGERLEFDIQKYLDTCDKRREAGHKGGSSGKKDQEPEPDDTEHDAAGEKQTKANGKNKKQTKANTSKKPDTDTVTDTVTETDTDTVTETEKETNQHYYYCSSKSAGAEAIEDVVEDYIPYGREQHLTTPAELQKMYALADELMHSYRSKKASPDDCEKVFGYVHTIGVTANGDHYGIYSQEKADLLRHAFEQASLRSDISWQYINRIYLNYDKNNVTNVDEAIDYERAWNRGEIA